MIYSEALRIIKNQSDVTFVYHPATASYLLVAGTKVRHLSITEFSEMNEADFMYEVVHTIRLAQIESANNFTQKH